jgi:hypothetical protein
MQNNRFIVLASDLKQPCTSLSFTGKYPIDSAVLSMRDKSFQVKSLNGKLIEKINSNSNHQ